MHTRTTAIALFCTHERYCLFSSSCACWCLKRLTVSHRRTSPTCVSQWYQLAADRDCDLPLAATSSSAQLSRTLVPSHLLYQDPKPGIIFWLIYVRLTLLVPLKLHKRHSCSVDYLYSLYTSHPCNRFMLWRVRNCQRYYYYYYFKSICLSSCTRSITWGRDRIIKHW